MASKQTPFVDPEANGSNVTSTSKLASREKKFRIAVIVLVPLIIALIIALIVVIVLGKKSATPTSTTTSSEMCGSGNCVKAATYLLDAMNPTIDPCDDFYKFTCGKWMEDNPTDNAFTQAIVNFQQKMFGYVDSELENTNLPTSVRKILRSYTVCKEYDGMTESLKKWIRSKVVDIGGWPMIENLWWQDDWEDLFTKAYSTFRLKGPIQVTVGYNPFETTNNVIHIRQPLIEETRNIDAQSVLAVAELLSNKNNVTLQEEMKDVQWLEQRIANLSKSYQTLSNDEKDTKVMTIENLQKIIPSVDWLELVKNMLRPYIPTDSITKDSKVYVLGITYVKTIVNYLNNDEISTKMLTNYAVSQFINSLVSTYPPELSDLGKLLNQGMKGNAVNSQQQAARCFSHVMTVGPVMDFIYHKHRKEKTIDRKTIQYLFDAMRDLVKQSTWLDEATKKKVHEKLNAVTLLTNFPPWTSDQRELDQFFQNLPSMTRNPFENKLNIDNFINKKDLELLLVKNDRNKWLRSSEMSGSVINAFHNFDQNQIVIPAGIQNLPLYDGERPMYMNFGGIGSVVGHEMTHGFDKIGSLRDMHGNIKNWWTDKAKSEFEKRAKCFIDQYDAFNYGRSGYETLSENIADNGGIHESYVAFKKWEHDHGKEKMLPGFQNYTTDQLFFMAYARSWCDGRDPVEIAKGEVDNHSAHQIRVLASLRNMKEFAEAFKCKVGSRMNPKNKCVIW